MITIGVYTTHMAKLMGCLGEATRADEDEVRHFLIGYYQSMPNDVRLTTKQNDQGWTYQFFLTFSDFDDAVDFASNLIFEEQTDIIVVNNQADNVRRMMNKLVREDPETYRVLPGEEKFIIATNKRELALKLKVQSE